MREGQGCTARAGEVRPLGSGELLNHLSHLPKCLPDGEACSVPQSWMLGCGLGFVVLPDAGHSYALLSTIDITGGAHHKKL